MRKTLIALLLFSSGAVTGGELWSDDFSMPIDGVPNPYGLYETELEEHIRSGKLHALRWPVAVTGALLPYASTTCFLNLDCRFSSANWIFRWSGKNDLSLDSMNRNLMAQFGRSVGNSPQYQNEKIHEPYFMVVRSRLLSFDRWTQWLGLYKYPDSEGSGVYYVPYPDGQKPDYRMGVSVVEKYGTKALTFSCAACHSESLFGRPVMGLTTRFSRANSMFYHGSRAIKLLNPTSFELITGASDEEMRMIKDLKTSMRLVDSKLPQNLGLDTSLSQVGLSLKRRGLSSRLGSSTAEVSWITDQKQDPEFPVSDSKPAVWWNVKFKNRWLSDGSLVSGNPILTNFLWNEIGRGTDLNDLQQWLASNEKTVREITAMVYAAQAPHITDFFSADVIDIDAAKRGEVLFVEYCARCHGSYVKNWSLVDAPKMALSDRLKTHRVEYFEKTKVIDVGTDPARYLGMAALLPLNELEISKRYGMKVALSDGYVAPPLVGIWARWPYFHNNAAPTLCDVLEPVSDRPSVYYARPARDRHTDFDLVCNGYPQHVPGTTEPSAALFNPLRYDTSKAGMSNQGHDRGITIRNGRYVLSTREKSDLILFLQTL